MKTIELADHVIGIAEILGVTEKEVVEALFDAFENRSAAIDARLDEVYWELDRMPPPNIKP